MCNITVIDTKPNIFNAQDIRTITSVNSLLGNTDGFGYYLFNDKFYKTKEEALIFWREQYPEFMDIKDYNGIYHVRKSSTYIAITNQPVIGDEKSHPFIYNDIVVVHNGCFNFRHSHLDSDNYAKDIMGDLTDTQKFSIVLSKICDTGKVTFDNIKYALNLFGGAFCLAIKGKKDNNVWLCRGKDRTLFSMQIIENDIPVGIVVNTTTMSLVLMGEFLLSYGYDYKLEELKENTTYKLELKSYKLEEVGQILQDSPYQINEVSKTYNQNFSQSYRQGYWAEKEEETIYEKIVDLMYKCDLLYSDLVVMCELLYNKSLFTLDTAELKTFKDDLSKLSFETHNGRAQLWKEICKKKAGGITKLYTKYGIQYPYFLNTKDELKSLLHTISKEKQDELPIVQ